MDNQENETANFMLSCAILVVFPCSIFFILLHSVIGLPFATSVVGVIAIIPALLLVAGLCWINRKYSEPEKDGDSLKCEIVVLKDEQD